MRKSLLMVGIFLFLSSCAFFQEYWEPGDVSAEIELIQDADNESPVVTIDSHTNGSTVGLYYTISGQISDNQDIATAVFRTDKEDWQSITITPSNWIANVSLKNQGIHSNQVFAIDSSGNVSDTNSLWVQSIADPVLEINSHESGAVIDDFTIIIEGTASIASPYLISDVKIRLNDGTWTSAVGTDMWHQDLNLLFGTNTIDVVAYCNNGKNVSNMNFYVYSTVHKIQAFDSSSGFGEDIAISGDSKTIVVSDKSQNNSTGAIYIYRSVDNWQTYYEKKITASDSAEWDQFGASVAISSNGNTIAVGSLFDDDNDDNTGSFYIYTTTDAWTNATEMKYSAFNYKSMSYFGQDLAFNLNGTKLVVGSSGASNDSGTIVGAVYLYGSADGWSTTNLSKRILVDDAEANDFFGSGVDISDDGNVIIAGAFQGGSIDQGKAYVFSSSDNWASMSTNGLIDPDGENTDEFGHRVNLSGDGLTALVSAHGDEGRGSASVFTASGNWDNVSTNKITPSEGSKFSRESMALSQDGTSALIGDSRQGLIDNDAGAAYYLETADAWNTVNTNLFYSPDLDADDSFGNSVAISPDALLGVIGANGDEGGGSIYLFDLSRF